MPRVGNRRFPYTAQGMKQASRHAKTTGQPLSKGYGQGTDRRGGSRLMRNPGISPRPRRRPLRRGKKY